MASVGSLSDSELRLKLAEYGYPAGPVTETSRNVLVKKLKHLMVQPGRSNDASTSDKWRRKSVRFSSGEEESDNEDIKSRLSSAMPPPSSNFKSVKARTPTPSRMGRRQKDTNSRKDINLRNDLFTMPRTSTPDKEPNKPKRSRFHVPPVSVGNLGARWSSSSTPPPRNVFKDGFDTGSDSDIDSHNIQSNVRHSYAGGDDQDSVKYRPKSTFLSRLSKIRSKEKSDDSGGGSSSVNTLLGYRKSLQSTSTANAPDNRYPTRTSSTPFQSNFYKRLSGWTSGPSSEGTAPSSIYDVKENDDVEISPNGVFPPSRWGSPKSQAQILREFKTTEDEGRFSCNYQVVSMVLLVVAAAFFAILAIIYVSVTTRDSVNFGLEDQGNRFPVCISDNEADAGKMPDEICLEQHEVMPAVKMIKILHPELLKRSISHQCSNYNAPIMTHQDAIKYLLRKDRPGTTSYLERYFRALKVLILSNPHWGITVLDTATGITGDDKSYHKHLVETGALLITEPGLPLLCYLKLIVFHFLPTLLILILGFIGLFSARLCILWYMRRRERDKLDMFNLVEQIIDVLVRHQQAAPNPAPVYLPVNHVRDEIIPSTDRARMAPLWDSAVKHIHGNESRIRCDTQVHDGEEVSVWSWIPHAVFKNFPGPSLDSVGPRKNTKMWQGQAFDTMTGCPNSLPCSPTPCLKIRHMFEPDMEVADNWPVRIEDAVLEKCEEQDVTAMHIYVDRSNRDGCVYLKCASQEDAGRAYRALHGWWFDSHLVTVKYLRLERYHERFPEAEDATIPLHPSNNQKLSLQWQGPLENN